MFMRFKPFSGPSRFEFKDPDTGFLFQGSTRSDLVRRIVSYRAQNGLEKIVELDKVIDNYLCHLPENKGKCNKLQLERGLLPSIKGGIALLHNLWFKDQVDQKEADRRSAICARCPYNVFPDKGPFIAWSDEIAEASVGERRSINHDKIGNCAVCSCPLRAKVWYGGEIKVEPQQLVTMKKVKCWQVEGK